MNPEQIKEHKDIEKSVPDLEISKSEKELVLESGSMSSSFDVFEEEIQMINSDISKTFEKLNTIDTEEAQAFNQEILPLQIEISEVVNERKNKIEKLLEKIKQKSKKIAIGASLLTASLLPQKGEAQIINAEDSKKTTIELPIDTTREDLIKQEEEVANLAKTRYSKFFNSKDKISPELFKKYEEDAVRGLSLSSWEFFLTKDKISPELFKKYEEIAITKMAYEHPGNFFELKKDKISPELFDKYAEIASRKMFESGAFSRVVECINHDHNEEASIRFRILDNFPAEGLYQCITESSSFIFTSSYNGILDRLFEKTKKEGTTLYQVFEQHEFKNVSIFLEASISYNRSNEIFSQLSSQEQIDVISYLIEDVSPDKLQNAIALIEFTNTTEDSILISKIENKIKLKLNETENKDLWKIIAATRKSASNDSVFENIDNKYEFSPLSFPNQELFEDGKNIQRYFFYDDEDGKASYEHMRNSYIGNGWTEHNYDSYIILSKKENDKEIELYLNKPDHKSGNEDIDKLSIEPQIIVHRGHSYHTEKTIDAMSSKAELVFLGSCGGFKNTESVLRKNSEAQIISTKGTGTMLVNDPLFKIINENMLDNKDISWEDVWQDADRQLKDNTNWKNYIRPDKNFGVLFIKKYQELKKQELENIQK